MKTYARKEQPHIVQVLVTQDVPPVADWIEIPWDMSHLPPAEIYFDADTIKRRRKVELSCSTGVIRADGIDSCVVQIIDRSIPEVVSTPVSLAINGETHEITNEPFQIGPTTEAGSWSIEILTPSLRADPVTIVALKEKP